MDKQNTQVRVRMAPSPTGFLHLGTAYTTFFNYLFAKRHNGMFILRLEDTDQQRSKKEFEDNILNGLRWLGLNWDEGVFRQMERLDQYMAATERLLKEGKAYHCFCTTEELDAERKVQAAKGLPQVYSGKCRGLSLEEIEQHKKEGKKYVIRFKMPENRGMIEFTDLLHGKISFDSKLLGDMVIMRNNGVPLYNFAVVVDDIDMKITHVLRGDDHISNTPKQIVIFEAFGASLPEFAHWPMILNPDRIGKLSKRNNATSVDDYKKDGFLPEAIINYFALLGWTMPGDVEMMSLKEMESTFDIKRMRLSGAAFDIKKFEWLNGEYIRMLSDDELAKRLEEYLVDHPKKEMIRPLIPLIKERMKKLSDFIPLTAFLFEGTEYDKKVFDEIKISDKVLVMEKIVEILEGLKQPWDAQDFEQRFRKLAEELGVSAKDMFQFVRVGFSGQLVTPPLFESMKYIGELEAIKRLKNALQFLKTTA